MIFNLIVLQASLTGEGICSMVLQDVAKAALCECAADYGIYSLGRPYCEALTCNSTVISATALYFMYSYVSPLHLFD